MRLLSMRGSLTRPRNCVRRARSGARRRNAKLMAAQNIYVEVLDRVRGANEALIAAGTLPAGIDQSRITVEPPRDPTHGDMATNAAMVLAKDAGKKPRDLAEVIAEKLRADPLIDSVE